MPNSYSQQSTTAFSSYCIAISDAWLVLGENPSLDVLNLVPLPQENGPRKTKYNDSESHCNHEKCAYIESWKLSTIFEVWQTANTKVHRSTDLSMQRLHKLEVFSRNTKLALRQNEPPNTKLAWSKINHHLCWDKKNSVTVHKIITLLLPVQ